jgi:hypothetical protein
MTGNNRHLSILALNINGLNAPKDIKEHIELKNRTQPYVAYKRLISLIKK